MSNIARMMQRATAGAGGEVLDIDEVFSTFLYDGTGAAQTLTNGIALGPVRTEVSLNGKTITNLGSSFDSSYPLSNVNDGTVETVNGQNIAYTSGTFDVYVDMGSAIIIDAYFLAPQGNQGGSAYNTPTGFTVSGSNNASSWTTIQTFSSITGFAAGSYKTFEFTNTTAYRYYRLAASNTGVSLSEWKVRTADGTGEGGLVWTKTRSSNQYGHRLIDEGNSLILSSDVTNGALNGNLSVSQYYLSGQSNGFRLLSAEFNVSGQEYVSWTFRKAPKFFDVVTWSGNGVNGRTISHSLGSVPGMILVKRTDSADGWITYHRGMDASSPEDYAMFLNLTGGRNAETYWNNTAPTSTGFTVSSNVKLNGGSGTYVAYVFAHNNSDGTFGPDSDQDIIKCGSYAGNGNDARTIDLGFEAQWVLLKRYDGATDWWILDNMRGLHARQIASNYLEANTSNAEASTGAIFADEQGFMVDAGDYNSAGENYIYMAIRRGPLAAPEDATKVFSVNETGTGDSPANSWPIGFETDMNIHTQTTGNSRFVMTRLLGGKYLKTNDTGVENTASGQKFWDSETGQWDLHTNWWTTTSNIISWSWKRAPSYFDAVAYSGTNSATTISHNLGAVPEMIWVKSRANANRWTVFHKDQGPTKRAFLELTQAFDTGTVWNNTAPTSTVFSVGTDSNTNSSGHTFIAYLFATVAGVSKVGSVTHSSGSTTNVDCGFSSGARFVLVKSTAVGYWRVWDSVRGIVAGNDPYIHLNDTSAEVTNGDLIDPYSGGFALAPSFYTDTYIFYAIA